jgi:quinol monooxygenase YgiN
MWSRIGFMIVRISKGKFSADRLAEAEEALAQSERALRAPLEAMPGLIDYYVAIDRAAGQLTNVSVWDTMEHAQAMSQLKEMLAQRPVLEAAGVSFELITNHDALWSITP